MPKGFFCNEKYAPQSSFISGECMQHKLMAVLIVLFAAYSFSFAERYARYNYVGYFPGSIKRIIVMSDDDCAGTKWDLLDQSKKTVASGVVGKSVFGKGDHTPMPFNYEIDFSSVTAEGQYTFKMQGVTDAAITVKKNLLKNVVAANLRFFYTHRSGSKNCLDREPGHFADSASVVYHRNGKENTDEWVVDPKHRKFNLRGGWYDGNLYTKYTASEAYATYYLLRAYEIQPSLFDKIYSTSENIDILDNAKCGLDYLTKIMPNDSEFIIQVGGFKDNDGGIYLPDKDPRAAKHECYAMMSQPQMGLSAAALALGSSVFSKLGKTDDAKKYRQMAEKIFSKALSVTTPPAWLEKDGVDPYKDETPADNMELAAIELYKLTKDQSYVPKIQKFAKEAKTAGWSSVSEQNLAAHLRCMDVYPQAKKFVSEDLDGFLNTSTSNGNIWKLPIEYTSDAIYSYEQICSAVIQYQMVTKDKKFDRMTQSVVDYMFGCNNWGMSFVSLKTVPSSVRNLFSQIYRLQTRLFPEGSIVPGPVDKKTQDDDMWCCFDKTTEPMYPFNTEKVNFFDNSDDESCVSATIPGVADGIFLFSLLSLVQGQ